MLHAACCDTSNTLLSNRHFFYQFLCGNPPLYTNHSNHLTVHYETVNAFCIHSKRSLIFIIIALILTVSHSCKMLSNKNKSIISCPTKGVGFDAFSFSVYLFVMSHKYSINPVTVETSATAVNHASLQTSRRWALYFLVTRRRMPALVIDLGLVIIFHCQGMLHNVLRRDLIRLALTLCGLPITGCTHEVRSAISCSSSRPPGTSQTIKPISTRCFNLDTTSIWTMPSSAGPHINARCALYPGSQIKRFLVPDDKVEWSQNWPQYNPVSYTDPSVEKKPVWADPDIGSFSPKFNTVDGAVDRTSFEGSYKTENGKPINPRGRTGVTGRGLLGRWGPNHAADPIVTRWKVDVKKAKVSHSVSQRPILQFVSIKRKDCGEWAIPGGMVDPGEQVSLTLQREFSEEALNSLAVPASEAAEISERIGKLFKTPGFQVYKGYVDDPRNTDNAWMETVAVNLHDESGNSVSELSLQAGDDAGQVQWVDVDSTFPMYANHAHFLELVAKERKAHW